MTTKASSSLSSMESSCCSQRLRRGRHADATWLRSHAHSHDDTFTVVSGDSTWTLMVPFVHIIR
ncbi:hypothetical protein JYU34_007011 [Plutella xylostella]|uniref:Uncharacterized protein n=1 Tax=Plutella xylostella TaxID=51655 RepID=A0ABQ7QPB8_PLUXY|nr:hypothetical protein JYU34_007011 [Plutella xylostella]